MAERYCCSAGESSFPLGFDGKFPTYSKHNLSYVKFSIRFIATDAHGEWRYSYNPCLPFSLGWPPHHGCVRDVAVNGF